MKKRSLLIFYLMLIQGALFSMERQPKSANEKPLPTTFYLVRHGQTDWNAQKRLQGSADIPLNDTGRREAAHLSEKLRELTFEACFSSDLQRASETAQILSATHSLNVGLDPRLRERSFGLFEGLFASELTASLKENHYPPSVENDEAVQKRVFHSLNEIADRCPGSTVLIVTHGGVIKSLLAHLIPIDCSSLLNKPVKPQSRPFSVQVKNMALLKLSFSDGQYKIQDMEGIEIEELPPY